MDTNSHYSQFFGHLSMRDGRISRVAKFFWLSRWGDASPMVYPRLFIATENSRGVKNYRGECMGGSNFDTANRRFSISGNVKWSKIEKN
jgi:hypothetical protein